MTRCRGCGIGLNDDPRLLAVHLTVSARCLLAYNDHTIWYRGREIVWGTLHLHEHPSSRRSKWRIFGLDRRGSQHQVHAEPTQTKATAWIKTITDKAK